jgi:predicted small lipoprotein YifL
VTPRATVALLLVCVAASGCGLKGALYLPEKSDVVIRPAPTVTAPATPAESAAPQQEPGAPEPPAQPEPTPPTGTGRG